MNNVVNFRNVKIKYKLTKKLMLIILCWFILKSFPGTFGKFP